MTDHVSAATVRFRLLRSDVFMALAKVNLRKMWFMLLLPIIGTLSILWSILDPNNGPVNVGTACFLLIFGIFIFVGVPYFSTLLIMKSPNSAGLMTVTVNDRGLGVDGEHSSAIIKWPMVKDVSDMTHATLINLKPVGFQIIPKRQISEADLLAFNNVLRIYLPSAEKLRR